MFHEAKERTRERYKNIHDNILIIIIRAPHLANAISWPWEQLCRIKCVRQKGLQYNLYNNANQKFGVFCCAHILWTKNTPEKKKSLCYSTITSESKPANYLRTMPPGLNEYFVRLLYPVCVCVCENKIFSLSIGKDHRKVHTQTEQKKNQI